MIITRRFSLAGLCLMLAACVTVNVYFPAAAAQDAADRFIKDVYQSDGAATEPPQNAEDEPQSFNVKDTEYDFGLARALLDFIIPPASAQQPDINISTPGINKLKGAMEARNSSLAPYYQSGAIGMTNNGLLTVRDPKAVPLTDRNTVKKLVADENRDRNALYSEIANANGHPEWEKEIRGIFSKRWVANAPGGWWFQDSAGTWNQK